MRFQNGFKKVATELLTMQFRSEIIIVISNRTRSFDFEITRQTKLHSTQFNYRYYCTVYGWVMMKAWLRKNVQWPTG